jgi:hypothetical protein
LQIDTDDDNTCRNYDQTGDNHTPGNNGHYQAGNDYSGSYHDARSSA